MFTKGQQVTIRPAAYPTQVWTGEVIRKTPNGFSVLYDLNGMRFKETFTARELGA